MERLFRDFKRGDRKKAGNISISRMLQAMLADTPLVRNLKIPVKIKKLIRKFHNRTQNPENNTKNNIYKPYAAKNLPNISLKS